MLSAHCPYTRATWFSLSFNCCRGNVAVLSANCQKLMRKEARLLWLSQLVMYFIMSAFLLSSQKCYWKKCRPWSLLFTSACTNVDSKCICVFNCKMKLLKLLLWILLFPVASAYAGVWIVVSFCVSLSGPFCVVFFIHFLWLSFMWLLQPNILIWKKLNYIYIYIFFFNPRGGENS